MEKDTLSLDDIPELVENGEPSGVKGYRLKDSPEPSTNRVIEPHLRAHQVKGRLYYYYCYGSNPEIYLGPADSILKAVQESKIASGPKGRSLRA